MKCGIVGLPNVGKSSLFNYLSNLNVPSENFPFCTINPNLGTVIVPDDRIIKLQKLVKSEKIIPATIEILDIAGIIKNSHKGEGLGNKFLSNIREVDAIIHVLRCFNDDNVIHIEGNNRIDPIRDKEIIDFELKMKDLETITNYIKKIKKISRSNNKESINFISFIEKIYYKLNTGLNIRNLNLSDEEKKKLNNLKLLTSKPIIYLCNTDEIEIKNYNDKIFIEKIRSIAKKESSEVIEFSIKNEYNSLKYNNKNKNFLFKNKINKLLKKIYNLLNLQTYFTVGKKEIRAWTIKKGSNAIQASSKIHSDFKKGFIKAEVIHYNDFMLFGSELKSRESGCMYLEGKEYIVKDGDIIHFRFNV